MADEELGADSAALVFVYGSLKRGQSHHDQLQGCAWQGDAELRGLALYDLGPFPMAVVAEPEARLQGEIYRVDGQHLSRLDRFEGAPRLYERQRWPLSDGRSVWVYVGKPHQVRHVQRLRSGCWRGRGMAVVTALLTGLLAGVSAGLTPSLAMPAVARPPGTGAAQQPRDLRGQCLAWASAHGREQVLLANRIGHEQLLTKTHRLAEAQANEDVSLYSWSDIQRLCRRL